MSPHAAHGAYCLNCHYTLSQPRPKHCGNCGQETDLHPPSMHEFIHEWVGHYVALEGPLWRTLWALIFLPGRLTVEYFAGRRRRYVLPLRVYLTASFIFFIGLHYLPGSPMEPDAPKTQFTEAEKAEEAKEAAEAASAAEARKARRAAKAATSGEVAASAARRVVKTAGSAASAAAQVEESTDLGRCRQAGADCSWFEGQIVRAVDKFKKLSPEQWKSRMFAWAPYAMLLMQPLFAALLLLMFAGTGRRYAEHFVFSLHMHAFWFLALGVYACVDLPGPLTLAVYSHGLLAMGLVYQRGRWGTWWRAALLSSAYLGLLGVGVAALSLLAALA